MKLVTVGWTLLDLVISDMPIFVWLVAASASQRSIYYLMHGAIS